MPYRSPASTPPEEPALHRCRFPKGLWLFLRRLFGKHEWTCQTCGRQWVYACGTSFHNDYEFDWYLSRRTSEEYKDKT